MSKKKKKEHHEDHLDESWLIPYADILTLLLALFIILFASSVVDQKKYERVMEGLSSALTGGVYLFEDSNPVDLDESPNAPADKVLEEQIREQVEKETMELTHIKKEIDQFIAQKDLSAQIVTVLNQEMLMIMIRDQALFGSGSAIVKPESQELAGHISELLSKYPQFAIEVAGHTDNVPIVSGKFTSNWDLSTERALNFMKYLTMSGNIGEERFRVIGYGEHSPVASNDTAEGRAKNRRVQVNILRNIIPANYLENSTKID